jgi:hypothetical protein
MGSRWLVVVLGLGVVGCGLADLGKFRKVSFTLPQVSASFDTADARWKAPQVGSVPSVACTDAASCCRVPAQAFDCATYPLTCDQGVCGYTVVYETAQPLDLAKMVPALANLDDDVLKDVLITELDYHLKNDLNVAVPAIDVYVAPANTSSSTDPAAKHLVALPGAPAGAEVTQKVPLPPAAQQAFSAFAKSFRTPFNLISVARVRLTGGSPTPKGRADATVSGQGEAHF